MLYNLYANAPVPTTPAELLKTQPIILDYAPPPRPLGRIFRDWLNRALRTALWFLFRRQTNATEVALGCWLFACAVYVLGWLGWSPRFTGPDTLPLLLSATFIVPAAGGLVRLLFSRRWRRLLLTLAVVLPTGFATGLLQFDDCPTQRTSRSSAPVSRFQEKLAATSETSDLGGSGTRAACRDVTWLRDNFNALWS